jgi:NAD(P)-dependent dehydrogenase (short-subunit alcohol dehydrogenase family)
MGRGEQERIDEQQADAVARLMQVNVVGPIICAKHAVRAMSTAHGGRGGSIVTIASVAARAPAGAVGVVPYEATKGALVTFARGLSNEVASEGIRSNSVSPRVIETDMASPDIQDDLGKRAPLGRLGQPGEIAATVSWLVSPEASFVTAAISPYPAGSDRPTAARSRAAFRSGRIRRRPGGRCR